MLLTIVFYYSWIFNPRDSMASKQTLIIAAVAAIVIIAAAAAFLLMNNNGNSNNDNDKGNTDSESFSSTRNLVYGNANNDDYLDDKDVSFIQTIVNGKSSWDKTANPLADANCDGKITSADVDLVKKFLKGESATMYYSNWYGEKCSVSYPLKGNISGCYAQVMDLAVILGCLNDVVGIKDTSETIAKYNTTMYPGMASKVKTVRTDTGNAFDIEKMLSLKTKIVMSDPFAVTPDVISKISKADPSINVIQLPVNRSINDIDWTHTVVTMGVMMNKQSTTADYVKYCQDVESKIADVVKKTGSGLKEQTFLICYMPSSPTTTDLDIVGTSVVRYGDVVNMLRLPLKCALNPTDVVGNDDGYIEGYEIEKVIKLNPDVIIVETWNMLGMTGEDYQKQLDTMVGYFKETGAYKNGKVISAAYEVYGTAPGLSGMPLMGSKIWGNSVFNESQGWDYLNTYYQKFTNLGKNVDLRNMVGYGPVAYGGTTPSGDVPESYNVDETRNRIYGNANNDNYLDSKDVAFIQAILNGKISWNKAANPYADANCDGKITSDDVTLVNTFLSGQKATMYYSNWYGEKCSVHYPVSGNISGALIQAMDIAIILGCLDDVVGIKDTSETIAKYSSTLYPGMASKVKTVRSDAANTMDIEKILSLKTKIVLGDPYAQTPDFISGITKADPSVNCIQLPVNRSVDGVDWTHTIVSLGVMMNKQSTTAEYVKYCEDVESEIAKVVAETGSDLQEKTFLICYMPSSPTTTNLDILGTGKSQYGDVINMMRLPLKCALNPVAESGYVTNYAIEDVITLNPDVIIVETWNMISLDGADYNDKIKTMVEYFKETNAYKNGQIVSAAYEVYGTIPGLSGMPLMGSMIWGNGVFNESQGWDYLNTYYQKFTNLGKNVDLRNMVGYGPETYGGELISHDVSETRNRVYGNANNDNYLDTIDVKFIQAIVDGKKSWNKATNPYADANCDGKVDSKDVELVNKFITGQKATMYYSNWYNEVCSVSYPLSGNISGALIQAMDMAVILDCLDDVVGIKDTSETISKYSSTLYPGMASKVKTVRSDSANTMDIEKILALKTKIVLGDPYAQTPDFISKITKADPSVNCIQLPVNRSIDDVDWTHTVVTLGVMMNRQSVTADYVQYCEEVESKIAKVVEETGSGLEEKTFLICYMPSSATTTDLDILGTGVVQYGDVINMMRLPLKCALDPVAESGYVENYEIEKVMKLNPDVIIVETWNMLSLDGADYDAKIKTMVDYFKNTNTYKNGKVITAAYEVYGTIPGLSGMPLMGSKIWGNGVFNESQGWDYLNTYYQKFTNLGKNVDLRNMTGYGPESYGGDLVSYDVNETWNRVYGNANNDNYLDSRDVKFIQALVDGKGTWNKAANPYADANNDGKITSTDVELVNKFLRGEKATMYYTDWDLNVDSISYPLTGKVAITQAESAQIGIIVGYYDDITHINRTQEWIDGNITDDMYPGLHNRVKSTGDYQLNLEAVATSGVSVLFGEKSSLGDSNVRAALKSYNIAPIALPCMMNYHGMDWNTTIVTVGVMMNKQANTADYIDYLIALQNTISKKASVLKDKTFIDIYGIPTADATTMSIQTYGEDDRYYGDVSNMSILSMSPAIPKAPGDGYVKVSTESVIAANPDIALIFGHGFVGADKNTIKEKIGNSAQALKGTDAFKDKRIFYLDWNIIGGPMGISVVLYIASLAYPDLIDQDYALQIAQDYFDNFSLMNVKLTDIAGILPTQAE